MESILVVCEFYGECKKAIQKALEVANESDFIYILYFIPPKVYEITDKKAYAKVRKEAKRRVRSFIEEVKKKKRSCKGVIRKGEVVSEISKVARKCKSTLILIGYTEEGIFSRYSMEELVQKIADITSVPVMIVR